MTYALEYYTAIKIIKLPLHPIAYMTLQRLISCERHQSLKYILYVYNIYTCIYSGRLLWRSSGYGSTMRGIGLIPSWGTKILLVATCGKKQNKLYGSIYIKFKQR